MLEFWVGEGMAGFEIADWDVGWGVVAVFCSGVVV